MSETAEGINANQKAPDNVVPLTANESALIARATFAALAGLEYGGDRDYYDILGYKTDSAIKFSDYWNKYKRQDIAKRIIKAPVQETWRQLPEITDDDDSQEETPFEKDWEKLRKRLRVFNKMGRADRLARIGQYGVLLIGVKGEEDLSKEMPKLSSPDDVIYLTPYTQNSAEIKTFEDDPNSPRFGLPKTYVIDLAGSLNVKTVTSQTLKKVEVHWSRVIHIAEDPDEDDVYGTPALEVVLNRLHDIVKVVGGSAEMFWRDAKGGIAFNMDKDKSLSDPEGTKEKIDEYYHNLRRYLILQGMEPHELGGKVADPKGHFDVIIALISAATNIPVRILLGSERGELASSEDEKNWLSYIEDRQTNHAEPVIIRPFIDRLMDFGAFKKKEYKVKWPNLFKLDEKDEATMVKTKAEAANEVVMGAASNYLDIFEILEEHLGLPISEEMKKLIESGKFFELAGGDNIDEGDEEVKKQWEAMRGGE